MTYPSDPTDGAGRRPEPDPTGEPASPWGQQPQWGQPPTWGQPPQWGQPQPGQPQSGQPATPGHEPATGSVPAPGYGPTGYLPPRPRPGIVPLRPLGLGEIFDGSFQAIRTNPRTMLGFSALAMVVVTLIGLVPQYYLLLQLRTLSGVTDSADVEDALGPALSAFGGSMLAAVVKALAASVLSALLVVAVSEAVLGRRVSPGELWGRVRPRLGGVLGVSVLGLLIPVGGLVVAGAVVGGLVAGLNVAGAGIALTVAVGVLLGLAAVMMLVWVSLSLTLAGPALVLEQVGVMAALRRSWRLVRGSWWRVFGIMLLTSVLVSIGGGIVAVPFSQVGSLLAVGSDPSQPAGIEVLLGTLVSGIGEIIGGTVMTPFSAAVTSLLYIDRRMRAEGLDIELARAAAQGGSGTTARQAPPA